jgi:non-specific serine/threonine protein kinase/protein-serine/threonine kinase
MDKKITAERDLRPGAVVDGFVLEKLIHKGGMAVIWLVKHPDISLPAVMKIPMIGEGDEASSIVGFEMEQMIMPQLTGKHVPKIFGMGDITALPYIAMERIIGKTLGEVCGKLPMKPEPAATLAGKIATGLVDLHRQQVIHFDLKPHNIIFRESNGDAVFVDFGLSRHAKLPDLFSEEIRIPMGTAPYIAPEQVLRNRTDPRSDIYSLGAILYEMITGEQPFGSPDSTKGLKRRIWADPKPPRAHNKDVPPWLQEIILRCLEPDPTRRYPNASQLAFDLTHPDRVKLTDRAEKSSNASWFKVWRRSKFKGIPAALVKHAPPEGINSAPIVMVAVDLSPEHENLAEAVLGTVERILTTSPESRLACVNILKTSLLSVDESVDESGRNVHLQRLAELKHWARPLGLDTDRVTFHVLEGLDPANMLIGFATDNHVDHVVMGARGHSAKRRYLGSVSTQVVAEAPCTVTVVRLPAQPEEEEAAA